jgi:hypothetical protein
VVGNQPLAISQKQFAISKTISVIFIRLSAGGADIQLPSSFAHHGAHYPPSS